MAPRKSRRSRGLPPLPIEEKPNLDRLLSVDLVAVDIFQFMSMRDLLRLMRTSQKLHDSILSYLVRSFNNFDYGQLTKKNKLNETHIIKILNMLQKERLTKIRLTGAASINIWNSMLKFMPASRELSVTLNEEAKVFSFASISRSFENLKKLVVEVDDVIESFATWTLMINTFNNYSKLEWFGVRYKNPSSSLFASFVDLLESDNSLRNGICTKLRELHIDKSDPNASKMSSLLDICTNLEILTIEASHLSRVKEILAACNKIMIRDFTVIVSQYSPSLDAFETELIAKMPRLR